MTIKYFVVSDIHSFFNEMKTALDNAGFDENNPNHTLIVCGDCFDRGSQSWEMFQYLRSLPRKVLIRGNHEDLILDCIDRGEPWPHDISNGTVNTVLDIGKHYNALDFQTACLAIEVPIKRFIDGMVNYYETEHYVFTHAGIPCLKSGSKYYINGITYSFIENWRDGDWETARWENPYDVWEQGIIVEGKTIVCGHWHTSYAHAKFELGHSEWGENADFSPFCDIGIIGIDGCTSYSHMVNVLVLED